MPKFWKRKRNAVKNWRSRAWSIDPKVTNLIIIKAEPRMGLVDMENFSVDFSLNFPQLLHNYPQYFEAVMDMEQFG